MSKSHVIDSCRVDNDPLAKTLLHNPTKDRDGEPELQALRPTPRNHQPSSSTPILTYLNTPSLCFTQNPETETRNNFSSPNRNPQITQYQQTTHNSKFEHHQQTPNTHRCRTPDFLDYCTKNGIPYYSGQMNLAEFLDCVKNVDNFFRFLEMPEDKQVKMVSYKLKGTASAWWDRIQTRRKRHDELPISSWCCMNRLMQEQFLPSIFRPCTNSTITVNREAGMWLIV